MKWRSSWVEVEMELGVESELGNLMQCMGGQQQGGYTINNYVFTPLCIYVFPVAIRVIEIFPRYCFRILSPWQFRNVNI